MEYVSMQVEITWVISTLVALLALVGGVIARDRYILNVISKSHEDALKAIQQATQNNNDRIDRVKDEYVRRVDLDGRISHLDSTLKGLTSEMRSSATATNQRLDVLLTHFTKTISRS
jgi:hypothetical protein